MNILKPTMQYSEIVERLDFFDIPHERGWQFVLNALFYKCDYIKIHGFGSGATLELCKIKSDLATYRPREEKDYKTDDGQS